LNLSKMLKRIIGENIDLKCHYAPALPMVQADIGMLEQALVNLVVNARDAMPDGGQLLITTERFTSVEGPTLAHPEARPGNFVCITVKDSGSGIAAENLPRIFEPFFTTKDVGKGTGLGLATVYGIVKQHEGWIEVSSQVGAGAIFQIFLQALECPVPEENDATQKPPELPRGNETILLVEDEEAVRRVTRLILERCGYRVLEAGSGPEALRIWEDAGPSVDLLLTDVIMPEGITGRKLAEQLRAKKASLKVIFQSGYSGEVIGTDGEFLGQTKSFFLQKPCLSRDLLCAVRHCLDGLPAEREQSSAGFETSPAPR
jgi:CheY-like chemotaxis protein